LPIKLQQYKIDSILDVLGLKNSSQKHHYLFTILFQLIPGLLQVLDEDKEVT
jgi:hypothetical protein